MDIIVTILCLECIVRLSIILLLGFNKTEVTEIVYFQILQNFDMVAWFSVNDFTMARNFPNFFAI